MIAHVNLLLGFGVVLSTAATDAVYVMFNAAVSSRRQVPAATWSSVWYLLSAFAVISYTKNSVYVCFAETGGKEFQPYKRTNIWTRHAIRATLQR